MIRRTFMKLAGLTIAGSGLACTTARPKAARAQPKPEGGGHDGRIVVLVELNGGNDGLNTVVPYAHDAYYAARPDLAIAPDDVIRLDDEVGLSPALGSSVEAWEAGELAIVQGVGYPKPNRSHFRSIEIWETATNSDQFATEGWLHHTMPGASDRWIVDGVLIGDGEPGPLASSQLRSINMREPEEFLRHASRMEPIAPPGGNPALAHVVGVHNEVIDVAEEIGRHLEHAERPDGEFPRSGIGRQLEVAARLIGAQVPMGVIKVRHGSFDTHANQLNPHQRLLSELSEALAVFRASMISAGLWDQVLVMTYSEFGRRVAQNGSDGTDHGTAAPHLLLGGQVKGGLYGSQPNLEDLDDGDLKHTVDFRSLYNTLAADWWRVDAPFALDSYPLIPALQTA